MIMLTVTHVGSMNSQGACRRRRSGLPLALLWRRCWPWRAVINFSVQVNRDFSPEELLQAYTRVLLKPHPDKGGNNAHTQRLQTAKETWQQARATNTAKGGHPRTKANDEATVAFCRRSEYRAHAEVVLLTYQGVADLKQWHRFVAFVQTSLGEWGCAEVGCYFGSLRHGRFAHQFGPPIWQEGRRDNQELHIQRGDPERPARGLLGRRPQQKEAPTLNGPRLLLRLRRQSRNPDGGWRQTVLRRQPRANMGESAEGTESLRNTW